MNLKTPYIKLKSGNEYTIIQTTLSLGYPRKATHLVKSKQTGATKRMTEKELKEFLKK